MKSLKKKLLSFVLTGTLIFSSVPAFASTVSNPGGAVININSLQSEPLDTIRQGVFSAKNGRLPRATSGSVTIPAAPNPRARAMAENTDPNNSIVLATNTATYGEITEAGQSRWYAANITQASKMSVLLYFLSDADYDLGIYKLNEATMTLEYFGESSTSGLGYTEFISQIVEPGLYFYQVYGYEGTGIFELTAYSTVNGLSGEINDSMSQATPITNMTAKTGMIDNPLDFDYYQFTLPQDMNTRFELSNYSIKILLNGTALCSVNPGVIYSVPAGTHYIIVSTDDGSYSDTAQYALRFQAQAPIAQIPGYDNITWTADGLNVFRVSQTDEKICTVNGHVIDFTWRYNYAYVPGEPWEPVDTNVHMSLIETNDLLPIWNKKYRDALNSYGIEGRLPYFASYDTNFEGALGEPDFVGTRTVSPVLVLSVIGVNLLVNVFSYGQSDWEFHPPVYKDAEVIIDVNTGKVIDITHNNFFYDRGLRYYNTTDIQ